MNADTLLQHFERLSEAPDGIVRLRRFVVDLAISDRLVPGKPTSEISGQLKAEILTARQNLHKAEQTGKKSSPVPISAEEIPVSFADPGTFARLGEIALVEKGATGIRKAAPGPFPLITLAEKRSSCDSFQFDASAAIVPLISSTGHGHASMKRLHYQEGKFALGNILCAVIPYAPHLVSARFLFEYLSAYREELLVSRMSGTANVNLTVRKVMDTPAPLVSVEAQKRVEELMALCDELETAQTTRENRRDRLVAATLHRLNNPDTDSEATFKQTAGFYLNHLPRLTTKPEHIQQLRQTILNLAVRGKLVEQDPEDEGAAEVLAKVEAEKQTLVESGGLKGQRPRVQIQNDELPYELPTGWVWCRLDDAFLSITDGDHQPPPKTDAGVPFLVIGNVRCRSIDFSGCRYVSESYYQSLDSVHKPVEGDILYTLVGSYGIPVLVTSPRRFCVQRHIGILRPSQHFVAGYLVRMLDSAVVLDQATTCATGIAQKTVPLGGLRKILAPVPPFAEQQRIATRADILMAYCDELDAQLKSGASFRLRFIEGGLRRVWV